MSFAHNTPIQYLPNIGPRTTQILQSLGVYTAGQLNSIPEGVLIELFGPSIRSVLSLVRIQKNHTPQQKTRFTTIKTPNKKSFFKRLHLATQFISML